MKLVDKINIVKCINQLRLNIFITYVLISIFLTNDILISRDIIDKTLFIKPAYNLSYSEISKSQIKYVISLGKSQYVVGEEIMINFKFINVGHKKDSLINTSDIAFIKGLIIKDSNGKNSGFSGPVHYKEENIILNPEEDYSVSSPLKFYRAHASVGLFSYFPKDHYRIKGYFNNGKTIIESNEINFEVTSPEGMEIEVFNEILNINKINPQDSSEQMINRYNYLLKKYPTSIYKDEIFLNSIIKRRITEIQYDSTLIQDCLWFIEKNPDSKYIVHAINEAAEIILYKYEGKQAAIDFILDLIETYPDSHISMVAQKLISNFESKK